MPVTERLYVVAAVIRGADGRYLLTRRRPEAREGGKWEFPGGKREPGETAMQALTRELLEELAIIPESAQPLIRIAHDYPHLSVLLDVWQVDRYRGRARPMEGQGMSWFTVNELGNLDMPAANKPIITAIRLPSCYLFTPSDQRPDKVFLGELERACRSGIRLVRLRFPELGETAYKELAFRSAEICGKHGTQLLLSERPDWVEETGAAGVHLNGASLSACAERPLPANYWVGASCHDREQLAKATSIQCDFAVLSPVKSSATHANLKTLGWSRFSDLVQEAAMPVYALAGMEIKDLPVAKAHGAQGIAAISGLWNAGQEESFFEFPPR